MDREFSAQDELLAYALGTAALRHLEDEHMLRKIVLETENHATQILEDIRDVLQDDNLDDPECFQRIEAIVKILDEHHITTFRHD